MSNEITMSRTVPVPAFTYSDIERMAVDIAKSNLFGIKNREQAIALMLLAQAEGLHPAVAARDYHIIEGKPCLKGDAMLSRFHAAGGRVRWHEITDTSVIAIFMHPIGGTLKIEWTIGMAERAGLASRDNWRKYPRAMMRNRVISEGIRSVWPAVISGIYTPEEMASGEPESNDEKPEPAFIDPEPTEPVMVNRLGPKGVRQVQHSIISDAEFTPSVMPEIVAAGLPENAVADWESALNESATPDDLKRTHAAAYRAAHSLKDTAALARFETAKNQRKADLLGSLT